MVLTFSLIFPFDRPQMDDSGNDDGWKTASDSGATDGFTSDSDAHGDTNLIGDDEYCQMPVECDRQQTWTKKKREGEGFVMPDGERRKYDAPPPPKTVDWKKIIPELTVWIDSEKKRGRASCVVEPDGNATFSFFSTTKTGIPDPDFFTIPDIENSVREAEEVVRPYAIGDANGDAVTWRDGAEEDLADRGIKLSDSFILALVINGEERRFGVRAFHVAYRYFLFVVLAGNYDCGDDSGEFVDPDGRPFVGFYYAAITKQEAEMNKCI
jgi:hypothetical protein